MPASSGLNPRRTSTARVTRGALLRAGGASGLAALALAGCGDGNDDEPDATGGEPPAGNSGSAGDMEVVDFALGLEILERDFYRQVLRSDRITSRSTRSLLEEIETNEADHADALTAMLRDLGGSPTRAATPRFDQVIQTGQDAILSTAAMIENLGAAAYLGQAARITDKKLLAAALSIHSVEARHAAALNQLAGNGYDGAQDAPLIGSIPDGPFAKPKEMTEVLEIVRSVTSNASR